MNAIVAIGLMKSITKNMPSIMPDSDRNVDLDITDSDGNVILRLKDGHIMTKNFDSSDT